MKDTNTALAPRDDAGLVVGLGLRVAELRQMNLELRDALVTLHDEYEQLSDLSHDLGDDLTTILSSANGTLLSAPSLDPAAGQALERIREAAERMARRIGAPSPGR